MGGERQRTVLRCDDLDPDTLVQSERPDRVGDDHGSAVSGRRWELTDLRPYLQRRETAPVAVGVGGQSIERSAYLNVIARQQNAGDIVRPSLGEEIIP